MLEFYPEKRISAKESLNNEWLKIKGYQEYKMNEQEIQNCLSKTQKAQKNEDMINSDENSSNKEDIDSDRNDADQEDYALMSDDSISEDEVEFDRRFLDRSFANQKYGYIGYGDGIQLTDLDAKGNWQFD